jgi:hypothetical protein
MSEQKIVRIAVVVRGGVVAEVCCDEPCVVNVIDYDDLEFGDYIAFWDQTHPQIGSVDAAIKLANDYLRNRKSARSR